MKSDRYYGPIATGYDAKRMHKPGWEKEQTAVADFVTLGPVLDCPVGTGRYLSIYQEKGLPYIGLDASKDMIAEALRKHPEAKTLLSEASILALPCEDQSFGTAVCSRLMNWLYPEDMAKAVSELRRVAREIVVSIRTGEEGKPQGRGNYTHRLANFYRAIDGLHIEERRTISTADDGTFEMFKLRAPTWDDVLKQFEQHHDSHDAIIRLSRVWTERYGIEDVDLSKGAVKAEYWSHQQLGELIDHMAQFPRVGGQPNAMITDAKPRYTQFPATVFRTKGHTAMIDGRRRSNQWRKRPGLYPVLVVEVESDAALAEAQ